MAYKRFQLAPGHNNPLGLQPLHLLNPPLFADFELGPETEWHDSEGEERDGNGLLVLIGRPHTVVRASGIYTAEHAYLKATFATAGPRSGPVTVQIHDRDTDTWPVYNAMLELPNSGELRWIFGGWQDYPLTLYDMTLLWAEADAPTLYTLTNGDYLTLTDGSYVAIE